MDIIDLFRHFNLEPYEIPVNIVREFERMNAYVFTLRVEIDGNSRGREDAFCGTWHHYRALIPLTACQILRQANNTLFEVLAEFGGDKRVEVGFY